MKEWYLCDMKVFKVYAFDNELDFETTKLEYPEDVEVSKDDAYKYLFIRISRVMSKKFSNYKNIDIMSECYYMLLKRYTEKGLYAPNKSFLDNERIWWSFAKKSCLYLLRQFRNDPFVKSIDVWSLEENETDTSLWLGTFDRYSGCENYDLNVMIDYIRKMCHSPHKSDRQLGLYGECKLNGLTDEQACIILEVGMPRLYEIRRALREHLKLRFDL
jgi:hypothetical protein